MDRLRVTNSNSSSKTSTHRRWGALVCVLLATMTVSTAAYGWQRCVDAFAPGYTKTKVSWRGSDVEALRIRDASWLRSHQLPVHFSEALVLGFSKDHVFVSHRGRRVDAVGVPGLSVRAVVRRNESLKADFFVFIRLEPGEAAKIEAHFDAIEKGLTDRSLSCASLSCSLVREGGRELMPFGFFALPSSLMSKMIDQSIKNPDRVEIGIVDGTDPRKLLGAQRGSQAVRMAFLPLFPLTVFAR